MDSRELLLSQGETVFFNDRIGQDFAGDSFNFRLCLVARQATIQSQLEIFPLPNSLQALVPHLLQSPLNRFALGIEDAFLEGDVDVGCHKNNIIREAAKRRTCRKQLVSKQRQLSVQFSQGIFELLAVPRILGLFELLQYPSAGEPEAFHFSGNSSLFGT
jgi:hypothetical protein